MMKRRIQRKALAFSFMSLGFFLLILLGLGCRSQREPLDLIILHVNDTHGHLLPFDDESSGMDVAGIARRATLIRKIRKENRGRTLVLHAGDVFSRGDPLASFSLGEANMLAMEAAGYDAMAPGEGEFYFTLGNLKKLANLVRFPVLAANIYMKKTGERVFEPYLIEKRAGVKIGILGLGKVNTDLYSGWSLVMEPPSAAAREFVPILEDKADLIIALAHEGSELDKVLAEEVPRIDVIVGGDDHVALDAPLRIPRPGGEGEVVAVQAGHYGLHLGRLDVQLQRDGSGRYRIRGVKGRLIPVDSGIEPDPRVERILARYEMVLSEVICVSKVKIANTPFGPSPMRSLVADAMRSVTGADVALLGAYMSSWSVQGEIRPGDVNLLDVYRIYNFGSLMLEYELTGAQLIRALTELKVHASGCRYQRVDDKIIDCEINGVPLELNHIYKVVVDDPLLAIDSFLLELPFRETSERVDTAIIKYLKQMGIIDKAPIAR